MSVKKEASGRRSVQVEVEVPGTPEQVWEAIATGPGVSCWFFPSDIEPREGGAISIRMGPGMEATATVTGWDPPRRFTAQGPGPAPEAPPMATEWSVKARSGDTCVVRVVHSLFAATDDWDDQLEGTESGWPRFFGTLRLYLRHFPGLECAGFSLMSSAPGSEAKAFQGLIEALGAADVPAGQPWSTPNSGAPALAGVVEEIGEQGRLHGQLRLEAPAPGILSLGAFAMGGQAFLSINFYFYGDRAKAVVAREEPAWQAWLQERYPMVAS